MLRGFESVIDELVPPRRMRRVSYRFQHRIGLATPVELDRCKVTEALQKPRTPVLGYPVTGEGPDSIRSGVGISKFKELPSTPCPMAS
jgi:hypothetical protein